ncbi:MAG: M48 family metallopeptidase [Bacteroidales bacterium]|nr:M48 family metallopeptidase [Bacteroidales bacterium]
MIWELIRANRRRSVTLFLMMGLVLVALGYLLGSVFFPPDGGFIGVAIALIIWLVQALVARYSGNRILLALSGARKVTPDVHPQLFHVVEEMRLAGGLPAMPEVYIIDEQAPNAFATGRDPSHSAVAVTAGLVARLNRDELQGVVAHEVSHVMNRDIRFLTYAGIMLGTVVLISEIYLRGMLWGGGGRYRSGSSKGSGQGQIIMMVLAVALAVLAPIMAQLLYFAISRKREYLADASAVRLTRYPAGLASALEKISANTVEMKSANKVTAPLYIANPFLGKGRKMADLTSTHPPISERIRILRSMMHDASFNGYQQAYASVRGDAEGIIPISGLRDEKVIVPREAADTGKPEDVRDVRRDAGDIMMRAGNFTFITCDCGLRLKLPPDYRLPRVKCPRCGRVHELDQRPGK